MKNELYLTWREPTFGSEFAIAILKRENDEYIFEYILSNVKEAQKYGFKFFPGFADIDKKYKNKELFPNILNRLPSKSRADYDAMLKKLNLDVNATAFEILIATKGTSITDNYQFVRKNDAKSYIKQL